MFNLSGSEMIFLLLIALVVLGPEKLPEAVRRFGKAYGEFKKVTTGFQSELRSALDEPMKEMRETAEQLRKSANLDFDFEPTRVDGDTGQVAVDDPAAAPGVTTDTSGDVTFVYESFVGADEDADADGDAVTDAVTDADGDGDTDAVSPAGDEHAASDAAAPVGTDPHHGAPDGGFDAAAPVGTDPHHGASSGASEAPPADISFWNPAAAEAVGDGALAVAAGDARTNGDRREGAATVAETSSWTPASADPVGDDAVVAAAAGDAAADVVADGRTQPAATAAAVPAAPAPAGWMPVDALPVAPTPSGWRALAPDVAPSGRDDEVAPG